MFTPRTQWGLVGDRDSESRGYAAITLGVLSAVEENSAVTQRSMARELGIALGLANAYLKRCVTKGYIKVSQIPRNRYAYYLTPKGFAEKSRLTAEFLSQSFRLFREARTQCTQELKACAARGWTRVALAGAGELCDIACLCARDASVQLVAIIDAGAAGQRVAGLTVVAELQQAGVVDVVMITDLRSPQETFDSFAGSLSAERIVAPPLLNVSASRLRRGSK